MKKLQVSAALWAFVMVSLILTGCGQPWDPAMTDEAEVASVGPAPSVGTSPKPPASPESNLVGSDNLHAERLGLQLVGPGKDDPEFPCHLDSDKCVSLQVTAQYASDEIAFREILPFGRPWFFVWKEDAFQIPIHDAHFEHRVQIPNNSFKGAPDRISASFDPVARVWFLPISKLGPSIDHNPVLQQWLKLDLLLANGKRIEIKVRFRALGALPSAASVGLRAVTSSRVLDLSQFVRSTSQWILKQEDLRNPANRPMKLWFKVGDSNLRTDVALAFHRFHDRRNAPPTGPHPEHYQSSALLKPGRLIVHRVGAAASKYLISPNIWTSIDLGPLESVRLEWLATPQGGAKCSLPSSQGRIARWTTRTPSKCMRGGECFGGDDVDHAVEVVETWHFGGAGVSGGWVRELQLTDAFIGIDHLPTYGVQLASGAERVSESVGAVPQGAPAFSCQGVF